MKVTLKRIEVDRFTSDAHKPTPRIQEEFANISRNVYNWALNNFKPYPKVTVTKQSVIDSDRIVFLQYAEFESEEDAMLCLLSL